MKKHHIPLLAGSVLLTGIGVYLYASKVEARNFQLETIRITTYGASGNGPSNGNHAEKKFRILHLSDLHLAYPESKKIDFLQQITDEDYDLVVLTGDVFENYSGLQYADKILARQPRLGAYAVLGNHDYHNYSMFNKIVGRINRKFRHPMDYRDIEPLTEALRLHGWDVMFNETRTLSSGVHIVGIDYPGIKEEELKELVDQAPDGHLRLALFHMPRRLAYLERTGVHLGVGGHTHGGQIRVPGVGALITDSELKRHEASGLTYRGNTALHISRGLSADPRSNFRLFCPPAATILEVTHQPYAANPREHAIATAVT